LTGLSASHKIPYTTGSLTRLLRLDTLADWILQTYAGFTQSGNGQSVASLSVQTKLRQTKAVLDFVTNSTVYDGIVAGTDTSDHTTYLQAALNSDYNLDFQGYYFYANNLTDDKDDRAFVSTNGVARIIKNANGALFTHTGARPLCMNISFRGDAASPTYTGDGAVFSGADVVLINCGSRWMSGRALKSTGQRTRIFSSCDIYQTTGSGATDWDIELGVSGTATLYHQIIGVVTTQTTGGILAIDVGGIDINGGQFGKLHIDAGSSPAGVGVNKVRGARINGNITVDISQSVFTGNAIAAVTLTFTAGTSGHQFDGSNVVASGATITDNSTASNIVDPRDIPITSYTPSWTAATANPDIGNGTITGRYSKRGNWVHASVKIVMGNTTTFGTGAWRISLPFVPSSDIPQEGTAQILDSGTGFYVGAAKTFNDGTARCQVFSGDNSGNALTSAIPFTWAASDELNLTIIYLTGTA
jgi:hypothetical protein